MHDNSKTQAPSTASTYRYNLSHDAPQMQLRLVLLCVTIVSYGTQAILAETARSAHGKERSVVWLAGVRRVGKTCLCQDLPKLNISTVNSLGFAA